jgi:hypothetical protein
MFDPGKPKRPNHGKILRYHHEGRTVLPILIEKVSVSQMTFFKCISIPRPADRSRSLKVLTKFTSDMPAVEMPS